MNATFTGPNGQDPIEFFRRVRESIVPTVGLARLLGSSQIRAMRERSFAGVDVHGNAYAPYSPAYARRKRKRGGSGIVNLFSVEDHEHMLDALATSVNGAEYGFDSFQDSDEPLLGEFGVGIYNDEILEHRLQIHNEGRGNVPRREVLGMSDQDIADRENEAAEYIQSKLDRLI